MHLAFWWATAAWPSSTLSTAPLTDPLAVRVCGIGGCLGLPRWARGRHQYPAHSPVVSQAPTEPHPAAWVYAARSQTHSVGPTPQDGPRLCREVDSALFGSTFFVLAGNSTSHVELAWVGRDLRARRGVAAVVTAAGRVPTDRPIAPERAIGRSTPNVVSLVAPLTVTAHGSPGDVGEVAPLTEKDAGSQVQNPEGTACPAVADSGRPASRLSSPDAFCINQLGFGDVHPVCRSRRHWLHKPTSA